MSGKAAAGTQTCPRCGGHMVEPEALSRYDNKTKVCAECGLAEGLLALYGITDVREAWADRWEGAKRGH